MNINTKGTNISLTPAISDYIEKRLSSLNKFWKEDDNVLVNVEVGKSTMHHKSGEIFRAEIHIIISGKDYYASSEKEDLYSAIDDVKDEIVHEITSKRRKALRLMRKGGTRIKLMLKGITDFGGGSWKRWRGR